MIERARRGHARAADAAARANDARSAPTPTARACARGRGATGVRASAAAASVVVLRPASSADLQARMLEGRTVTVERIYARLRRPGAPRRHASTTPGQEILRETGRFLWFFPPEVEVVAVKRILVAGDRQHLAAATTASAARSSSGSRRASCPTGAVVFDFGTGGLDLAYEVMRGYDALVLVDVSRQGGEPGTLYVMEAPEEEVEAGIEDGQVLNPHGMDPQTVLRFVKTLGALAGQGARRGLRAGGRRGDGHRAQRRGRASRRRRRRTSSSRRSTSCSPTPRTPSTEPCTSCRSPARS